MGIESLVSVCVCAQNFVDDQVGRLWQWMNAADKANTLFVVVSDHGEMLGDHHMYRKTYPYESSARIPFLIKAPSAWNLPVETVCKSPVGLQDVMPTILSAAGVRTLLFSTMYRYVRMHVCARARVSNTLPMIRLFEPERASQLPSACFNQVIYTHITTCVNNLPQEFQMTALGMT